VWRSRDDSGGRREALAGYGGVGIWLDELHLKPPRGRPAHLGFDN